VKAAVIVVIVLVVGVVVFLGVPKVRTYLTVGRENLVQQIDKALGEFKVKQTEVKAGVAGLDESVKKLREGQITSEVQAEQLGQKLASVNEKKAAAQASLAKLRDLIAKNESATLGGKQYTVAELQSMAERLIAAYKSMETQGQGIERARTLLQDNAKSLESKGEQAKAAVASMKSQLEEIDAKVLALGTMREAAKTAGVGSDSLADSFRQVQDQVNSLYAKVETNLRMEEDSWKQTTPGAPVDVDSILKTTGDAESTLNKIDEVLGKK
jgi:chromosome segregation ATPase